jgi:hypothetical protein
MRLAGVLLFALMIAAPASAEEKAAAETKTAAECAADFSLCNAECAAKHADDTAKRAACTTACSGTYLACDAKAAYEAAKPWVKDKMEKTKKFLDDLDKDDAAKPAPQDLGAKPPNKGI